MAFARASHLCHQPIINPSYYSYIISNSIPSPINMTSKSFTFEGKKFFLHLTHSRSKKMVEVIKQFGGQIEQFLDHEISYLLTDIPRSEWPPKGGDVILVRATQYNVKLMALDDLIKFCKKYVSSQSSGDDDDEHGINVRELKAPYIKFEDAEGIYRPYWREFSSSVKIKDPSRVVLGESIFENDSPGTSTQSTAATNSIAGTSTQPNHNNCPRLVAKRKRPTYCEVCNLKFDGKIGDHSQTQAHKLNASNMNWSNVEAILASLPDISTLKKGKDMRIQDNTESSEFLCLHKVDSGNPLFPSSDMPVQHWVTNADGTRIRLN